MAWRPEQLVKAGELDNNVSKRNTKVYRYYTGVTAIKRGRKH